VQCVRPAAAANVFTADLPRFALDFVDPSFQRAGVALVTGGSAGLGLAIADALLAAGYTVIIAGRDESRLSSAVAALSHTLANGRCELHTVTADVTSPQSVEQCFSRVAAEHGRLDVLVNCVGQSDRGRTESLEHQRLLELIDANVTSALLCCQAALPMLKESRGVVINVGSLASKVGARYLGGYCAAKHALAGLTQQMRLEWLEYGVHVGLVSPGPIRRGDAGHRYSALSGDAPPGAQQPGGGAKLKGLPAQKVAQSVVRSIRRRRADVILPGYVRLLVVIGHALPSLGDWLLRRFTSGR
jgi:uncharacterized protein